MDTPYKLSRGLAIIGSAALVVLTVLVNGLASNHRALPQSVETIIRNSGTTLGVILIPILSTIVWRFWADSRHSESGYRNAVGFFVVVTPAIAWLMLTGQWLLRLMGHFPPDPLGLAIIIMGYLNFLAALLTIIVLRGPIRFLGVAPALLVLAWIQSSIFI